MTLLSNKVPFITPKFKVGDIIVSSLYSHELVEVLEIIQYSGNPDLYYRLHRKNDLSGTKFVHSTEDIDSKFHIDLLSEFNNQLKDLINEP